MPEPENPDRLVEVLKEIRDELRAVRMELGAPGDGMSTGSVRTEVIDRGARWRSAALAAGAVAGLALVIGLVMRDRPASAPVAVASPSSAVPTVRTSAVTPAQAPVVAVTPMPTNVPPTRPPAVGPAPTTKPPAHLPAGGPAIAAVPLPAKKRVKRDVAADAPAAVASEADEPMAFPPSPKRVRVHRLSYGPVGSEPAKL